LVQQEIESYVASVITALLTSSHRVQQYQVAQEADPVFISSVLYRRLASKAQSVYPHASLLGIQSLIHFSKQSPAIVVPESLRILDESLSRPPGNSVLQTCPGCAKFSSPLREPMNFSALLDYPWQNVGFNFMGLYICWQWIIFLDTQKW